MTNARYQDLSTFRLPSNFRGKPSWFVQLWWLVEATLFRASPQFMYGFRRSLLRLFGARIGRDVIIRPTVRVTYPWKLSIADYAWIGDDVVLYTLGHITIEEHVVISQGSYVCAADHDHADVSFLIRARPIVVKREAWVATRVFVGPGVTIGEGAVIGACSSVFADMPSGMICMGSPCIPKRPRVAEHQRSSVI